MNNERLKTLLYNAIMWIEEDDIYFDCETQEERYKKIKNLIGISKEEYKEIMED
jgi:redox-regulated HSP33 family molecular chaperone